MPGEWHKRMQSMFPNEQCEIGFCSYSKSSSTEHRRTDVFLSNLSCLEVQHSYISCDEVCHRKKDWEKFGKTLIWLVDGNTSDVCIETLNDLNAIVTFHTPWKFQSFSKNNYEFVLLECNDRVYKIKLNAIKYKTIRVNKSYALKVIIECLQTNPEAVWDLWKDDNSVPSRMIVHQKGAGNGKTYGIWKSILTNSYKDTFIIITKQHSAKTVIYNELNDQASRHEYHFEDITNMTKTELPKHYVIKYTHKHSNRSCKVIIGTIDSYVYNLSRTSSNTSGDMFTNLLQTIIRYGCDKIDQHGKFKFAKEQLTLNKHAELWIDEAQDLNVDYFFAIQKIMLQTGIDVNVVGDVLQSLEYKTNFMTEATSASNSPDIVYIKSEPINSNRRIKVTGMLETINYLVPFDKYNLPAICIEDEDSLMVPRDPSFEIIKAPIIRPETPEHEIEIFIDTLLEKIAYEVDTNGYLPEDFMFIFPIMNRNLLAGELETRLNEYWISKFEQTSYKDAITDPYWKSYDHDEYTTYAFIHKHEDGTVIDLSDSERASRLVTIKTSKGDGRKVVFVLNCTEYVLKIFTNQEINILYESYLHVALTRAKHKVYFGLINNGDDICKRFSEINDQHVHMDQISRFIQLNAVLINFENEDNRNFMHKLNEVGHPCIDAFFDDLKNDQDGAIASTEPNDWKYHCMKRSITHYYIMFALINLIRKYSRLEKDSYPQLMVVFNKISKIDILKHDAREFYKFLRKFKNDELPEFPLCNLSNKAIYNNYCNTIRNEMERIQHQMLLKQWDDLDVYQMFLLDYMIAVYMRKQFAKITPTDMYDIAHCYAMRDYNKVRALLDESVRIKPIVNDCLEEIYSASKSAIHWNIHKSISYDGKDSDFVLVCGDFTYVGWDEENVYHLIIQNDVSSINENTFLLKLIFERFILYNCKSDKDKDKFQEKKIVTYVLLLNNSSYHKIDWTWDKDCQDVLVECLHSIIYKKYQINHIKLYNYLGYVKTKRNKDTNKHEYYGDGTDFQTPFGYVFQKLKDDKSPEYLISFFNELDRDWKLRKRAEVKEITQNADLFCSVLDERLNQALKDFFKSNDQMDDEDF